MCHIDNDIIEIVDNDNLSVKQKIKQFDDYLKYCEEMIEAAKEVVKKHYIYCPKCKDYYKINAWETGTKDITYTECTNPFSGYLENYKYETRTRTVQYYECPKGHKILEEEIQK